MQDFRKLKVWNEAQDLAVTVYRQTRQFPNSERTGLTAQMRRAAVSMASNIAEGAGRRGPAELSYFLQISIGSSCELSSQIDLAHRLGLIDTECAHALSNTTERVRRSLINLQARVDAQR